MLVICEDCAKKYHIDENRITAARAKFPCKACGHIIVVEKPEAKKSEAPPSTLEPEAEAAKCGCADKAAVRKAAVSDSPAAAAGGRGKPAALTLLPVMLVGLLAVAGMFWWLYFSYVPELISRQINLRGLALAIALKETVRTPLQQQNHLEVNLAVRQMAKLPGVAYAAVTNEKGVVVAYDFNTLNSFDSRFVEQVKEKGFPADIIAQSGLERKGVRITVGGLPVYDRMMPLADIGGEIHVGIPVAETDNEIRAAFFSPLLFAPLGIAAVFAMVLLILVDRLLIRPLRTLTAAANRISLGELELAITPRGPRELRELAAALKRMRHSLKTAVDKTAAKPK